MGDDKPFACNAPGCEMRFTNEDHLTVHRKKHEMCLSLNVESDSAKSSNVTLFVDQTPTPTRFIRTCEEVGLFQDLQSMNPFEEHFRKATEAGKPGHPPTLNTSRVNTLDSDILNTPSILASDLENETHLQSTGHEVPTETDISGEVEEILVHPDGLDEDDDNDGHNGIGLLNMQDEEGDGGDELCVGEGNMEDSAACIALMGSSPSMSPASSSSQVNVAGANDDTILTQSMMTPICFGMGDSSELSILPTTESFSSDYIRYMSSTKQPSFVTIPPRATPAPVISLASVVTPSCCPIKLETPTFMPAVTSSSVAASATTTMVQLILRLPDGSSVPVNIPSLPVVTSSTTTTLQSMVPAVSQGPFVTSKNTASYTKLKLKQLLTHPQGVVNSGPVLKLVNERHVLSSSDFLNMDSTSNDSDSHDRSSFSSKRQRLEEDDDEKRKRFLERNRAAATRCRQKRKQWVQSLEGKADELSSVNQQLQNEVAMLRDEVAHLKSMLLAHKDCPITQQQQKKMTHMNGSTATSSVIVGHPGASSDVIHLSAAEVIASSALTNLARATGETTAVAAPSGSQSPVILHTFMSREQAVALLNLKGIGPSQSLAAVSTASTKTGSARRSNVVEMITLSEAVMKVDDEIGCGYERYDVVKYPSQSLPSLYFRSCIACGKTGIEPQVVKCCDWLCRQPAKEFVPWSSLLF